MKLLGLLILLLLTVYPFLFFAFNNKLLSEDIILSIVLMIEMLFFIYIHPKKKWFYMTPSWSVYKLTWQANAVYLFNPIVGFVTFVYFSAHQNIANGTTGVFFRLFLTALPLIWIGAKTTRKTSKYPWPWGTFKLKKPKLN